MSSLLLFQTLRGAPSQKLVEVLEKYVKRGNSQANDDASVAASDVLEYYDKYVDDVVSYDVVGDVECKQPISGGLRNVRTVRSHRPP